MSRPESLCDITPSESGAEVRTRVTFLCYLLAPCNISSSGVQKAHRNPRRSSCWRLPRRRPFRLPKSPTIHRKLAHETRIPGVRPTKLFGKLALLVKARLLYRGEIERKNKTYPNTSSWLFRRALIPLMAISTSTLVFWIWIRRARMRSPRTVPTKGDRKSLS